MHHLKAPNGTVFNYNSDLSGEVHVLLESSAVEIRQPQGSEDYATAKISGEDLIFFVGQALIGSIVGRLQQLDVVKLWKRFR